MFLDKEELSCLRAASKQHCALVGERMPFDSVAVATCSDAGASDEPASDVQPGSVDDDERRGAPELADPDGENEPCKCLQQGYATTPGGC